MGMWVPLRAIKGIFIETIDLNYLEVPSEGVFLLDCCL